MAKRPVRRKITSGVTRAMLRLKERDATFAVYYVSSIFCRLFDQRDVAPGIRTVG